MKMLRTDDLWILKQLQGVGYTSAIVAGGAVRDAYFDRFPRDIDIFLWHPDHSNEIIQDEYSKFGFKCLEKLFHLTNLNPSEKKENDPWDFFDDGDSYDKIAMLGQSYYKERAPHVVNVWSIYVNTLATEFQLILLNKPPVEYVTKYFDFGLCMCYCDGTKMRYTNEFLIDASNKTMTICGDLTESEYKYTIENRVAKLRWRFPGYTLIDPLKDMDWPEEDDLIITDDLTPIPF